MTAHISRHPAVDAVKIAEVHYAATDAKLIFEGNAGSANVDAGWMVRYQPKAGDWFLRHADGQTSSMKPAEFEAAYKTL